MKDSAMRRMILQGSGLVLVALTTYVALLVATTLWEGGPRLTVRGGTGERQAKVTEAIAANRLRLETGEEVLLGAVTVPEPGQPFAEEGKQASRALAVNQVVRVVGPAEAAYVYLPEGMLLQEMLISGGYARLAPDAPNDEIVAQLRQAEAEARDRNLGLWGGIRVAPVPTLAPTLEALSCEPLLVPGKSISPGEAAANKGQVVNVIFFPTRVEERSGGLTLLAGLTEDDFGVVIPAGLASTVEQPAVGYLNRCVVVTGRIEEDVLGKGPRIVLRDFGEILILR